MTTKVKLDLVKESDFIIEETENDIYITGTSFVMPSFDKETWSKKNLNIQAYDLTFTEDIIAPRKKIIINTRYLRNNKDLNLSVSGLNGDKHLLNANNGRHAGAHGIDGFKGKDGENAGEIIIIVGEIVGHQLTLLANGGKGGPGQNGGNGAVGVTGSNSGDRARNKKNQGPGIQGGQGGKGGNAGQGGAGGNGGNAGKLEIYSDNYKLVKTDITVGAAGEPGLNGSPGLGGLGGRGGRGVKCKHERDGRATPLRCRYVERGPNGLKGEDGDKPEKNSRGTSGKDGSSHFSNLEWSFQMKHLTVSFIKMLLHEIELDYLNERRNVASQKLMWLERILSSGDNFKNESVDQELTKANGYQDKTYRKVLLERVQTLLIQLSQGLDFYGNFHNFVPLTSVKIYEASINQMLVLSKDIEEAYEKYYDENQNASIKRNSIVDVVNSIELQKDSMDINIEQMLIEVEQSKEQIADLLDEILVLEQKITNAKEEFENAVSREAACDFSEVIKAAAAIAAIASGVGTVAGGLAMLSETNDYIQKQDVKKRLKSGANYISKYSKTVKGGFDGISKGYSDVKDILDKERDGAKIIASETDFEEAVRKFEHLPEAIEYRNLVRQFLSLNKTCNNKILEVDSKTTCILELEIQHEELQLDIDATRSRMIQIFNPRLAEHVLFFERAAIRSKSALLRAIVMEHKALQYWGLTGSLVPRNLHDRSIAQLSSFHLSFKEKYLRLIEERNAVPSKINPAKISFTRETQENIYDVFDQTGSFSFEITPAHHSYRFFARVLVNTANISIETYKTSVGWSWVFLRHNGVSTIVDQLGKTHNFSHRMRVRFGEVGPEQTESSISLGGEIGKYAYLSPFTNWTFMMEFADEDGTPLSGEAELTARKNIKSISVRFEGIADTRYGSFPSTTEVDENSAEYAPESISTP